jgi:hypothetical protein
VSRLPHHGRNGSRHIGRLRIAAAKILTEGLGFPVRPEEISPATGRNRTDWREDCYRWEVFTCNRNGVPKVYHCWDPLSRWVPIAKREGFHVNRDCEICAGRKL